MKATVFERTMHDLVSEIDSNYTYLLNHFFSNMASKSVDVTIHNQGMTIVIPDIWDISAMESDTPYLYFIPSHFVSYGSITNTNIADMVQLSLLPQDRVTFTLIKREELQRDELQISIDRSSSH
ncbi:hypothetical protein ASD24_24785 [Paenibacillus sp. Root52]|uniref:hypothetical protein n=1 Tax=Paenibacillus sp. Root52 TaxID=1736552 RepID=UPI0006FC93DA|nr:hypothetical protein [Paenibacillus sp. Root52]KQY91015.1 hypothetical protein ASD24_24785 [Paenibacillus sp. Root52]